jgi:hypothetical protein
VAVRHVPRIFAWTAGVLVGVALLERSADLGALVRENPWAMLPLLAQSRKDFLRVKAANLLVGLAVGAAMLALSSRAETSMAGPALWRAGHLERPLEGKRRLVEADGGPWNRCRTVSRTKVSGERKRPPSGGPALLMSRFWPKLQLRLPTVRARLPGSTSRLRRSQTRQRTLPSVPS